MDYLVVYRTKRKLNAKEKSIIINAKNSSIARTLSLKQIGYKNAILSISKMEA